MTIYKKRYDSVHQRWKCSKEMKSINTGSETGIKHRVIEGTADLGNADSATIRTK